jgi:hypothetical protein
MIVYHGTTTQRARRICREGLRPMPPSHRVWFAEDRKYAYQRAQTWAYRTNDRAIILTADVDVAALRQELGHKRVMHKNGVVAVEGSVPTSMLRWHPEVDLSATPAEVAQWLNDILGPHRDRRVDGRHPGVRRLARWIEHQVASRHRSELRWSEIRDMARKWLPEHFLGLQVGLGRVRAAPLVGTVHVEVHRRRPRPDPRIPQALELLGERRARRRARGIKLLAEAQAPDLFEWCTLLLGDEALSVRLAALEALLACEDAHSDVLLPLVGSASKRIRARALAGLAVHGGARAPQWFERGLKDPAPCVRIAVARQLHRLDPARHEALFELALADPNPDVVRFARKSTAREAGAQAAG